MSNAAKPVEQGPDLPTELPKRKRGRPRKHQQEPTGPLPPKKPRGRPKGSKKLRVANEQVVHTLPEKRPRGRPRKWLIVQEGEYENADAEGRIDPCFANSCPTLEGTSSGKGCPRTNQDMEFKRPWATSTVQQQPTC